ncbi:DUF6770 family protein [Pontibacter mangrovi]|uniref:DUF4374 domain-containing protein n=1 Tax=Pontibacter mangrovi TaxID=2589816 RepID=A0A501WAL2_9BACT|nr:DUF6770 family protein [Pontibacter mangrovi]TPE44241.1 hypothetical protein FJM65_08755 [Pontibacter mangrovi]
MRKRIPLIALLALSLCTFTAKAQQYTLAGFSNFNKEALNPVYVGAEVQGYSIFYRTDQADKKHYNYGFDLFDQNLQKLKNITITKEGYYNRLLGSWFNGKSFAFYFYDAASGNLELDVYDNALNKVKSVELPKISSTNRGVAYQQLLHPLNRSNRNISELNLYPVPQKGFIRNAYTRGQKGFELEMYDNNLELKWSYQTDKKAKGYETIIVNEVTDKYLLATIGRSPSAKYQGTLFYIAAFDVETGEKVLDYEIGKQDGRQLVLGNFRLDGKKGEVIAAGEFYAAEARVLKDHSQGMFIKRIGLDGKEKHVEFYEWDKGIAPMLPQGAMEGFGKGKISFVHDIVQGRGGRYHIITEQYTLRRDGVSVALAVMGSVKPTVFGIVGDMAVYTLSPDLKLSRVDVFDKEETKFGLPRRSKPFGNPVLGHIIKRTNGFDYQFTQGENNPENLHLSYTKDTKLKRSRYDQTVLESVAFLNGAGAVTDKLDISSSKEITTFVYPAKTGYVMVLNNVDNNLEMKLVKLNK